MVQSHRLIFDTFRSGSYLEDLQNYNRDFTLVPIRRTQARAMGFEPMPYFVYPIVR